MLIYNPWGRSGCGAPVTDQNGNIISDLRKMHRLNEEPSRNPVAAPSTASNSGFRNEPSPQQLNMQFEYKEALKQQIEENRRKQEEEREQLRMEEEKEEKRLAAERESILRNYEEEQRREELKIHLRLQKQNSIHRPNTPQQVKKRTRREKANEVVIQRATEKWLPLNYERELSAPVPALQKKHLNAVEDRPSSAESFVSAPRNRANPAGAPQAQDGQQEILGVLSALLRNLSTEKKQLEVELSRNSPEVPPNAVLNRKRAQAEIFDHQKAERTSVWSPGRAASHVNEDNIREFTRLKYRDTDSREEVRSRFPNPPTDAQTLDIQQQALLRQQQNKIRRMNQQKLLDFLENEQSQHFSRKNPGPPLHPHTDRSLPSETMFMEFYGSDGDEEDEEEAERRDAAAGRRSPSCDELTESAAQNEFCEQSLRVRPKSSEAPDVMTRDKDQESRTGVLCDEVVSSSLRPTLGRSVSVETVATDPWLRPGSSDAVKHREAERRDTGSTLFL